MKYTYNNKMGNRGRRSHLWLRDRSGKMHRFDGCTIENVVVVVGSDYEKNGKWSSTTYRLNLANGVTPFSFMSGWETGTIREGLGGQSGALDTWIDFANHLQIDIEEAKSFLRSVSEKAADHYDRVQRDLDSMQEDDIDVVIASISFGNPTNRQIGEGFWDAPVVVIDENGREAGRILPVDGSWVSYCDNAEVVSSVHSSGMHGGYYTLKVALPDGWSMRKLYS